MTAAGPRTIVLLHPGAMGVTVGRTLLAGGHRVRWCAAGRSAATGRRAAAAALDSCRSLVEALDGADAVISVCPPGRALEVAGEVTATGYSGAYLDANAVAPATARQLQAMVGERFVDGGIIGPPALREGTTRLYLSGREAPGAAAWFAAGPLAAVVLSERAGDASALKMCYAAYTKGSSALLLAVRALAEAEGVTDALLAEWQLSQAGLGARSEATAQATAGKAWRFVDEMLEIAATFDAAGLPAGFHGAAADVYRRMAALKDLPDGGIDMDAVLAQLTGPRRPR